jgi:hypothetical protein
VSGWVTEWGVRYEDGVVMPEWTRARAEAELRRAASADPKAIAVVSREVEYGDWEDAS